MRNKTLWDKKICAVIASKQYEAIPVTGVMSNENPHRSFARQWSLLDYKRFLKGEMGHYIQPFSYTSYF